MMTLFNFLSKNDIWGVSASVLEREREKREREISAKFVHLSALAQRENSTKTNFFSPNQQKISP